MLTCELKPADRWSSECCHAHRQWGDSKLGQEYMWRQQRFRHSKNYIKTVKLKPKCYHWKHHTSNVLHLLISCLAPRSNGLARHWNNTTFIYRLECKV